MRTIESHKKYYINENGEVFRGSRKINPKEFINGYLIATLCDTSHPPKTTNIRVDVLVAEAYLNYEGGPIIHLDGNKKNNRLENLELVECGEWKTIPSHPEYSISRNGYVRKKYREVPVVNLPLGLGFTAYNYDYSASRLYIDKLLEELFGIMTNGTWKEVVGHPNYEVSCDGRVRNKGNRKELTYKQMIKGNTVVTLYIYGFKTKTIDIGTLVAEAFIGVPEKPSVLCRVDEDKSNNNLNNLYYEKL